MLDVFETFTDTPVDNWQGYKMNYQPVQNKPVHTESEIEQLANIEWLESLAGMWDAIGKTIDEKRLQKYAKEFSNVPLGLLEQAVSRSIRNGNEFLVVPTIGSIWNSLRKELGNPKEIDVAIERWVELRYQSAIYKFTP